AHMFWQPGHGGPPPRPQGSEAAPVLTGPPPVDGPHGHHGLGNSMLSALGLLVAVLTGLFRLRPAKDRWLRRTLVTVHTLAWVAMLVGLTQHVLRYV
ncbi:MAG: hypothetical protein ABFD96_01235, partial [Armatimonadia bacterium]